MSGHESFKCFNFIQYAMARVNANYIILKVAGGSSKHRERVYCYELYHQMRCLQEQCNLQEEFTINGEIDKKGHPTIPHNFNPDFVMHEPGDDEKNICVIEVKIRRNPNSYVDEATIINRNPNRCVDKKGVHKDLNTITCMLHCYSYKYGALIFIDIAEEDATPILRDANITHLNDISDRVMVFFQSKNNPCNVSCKSLKEILEGGKQ